MADQVPAPSHFASSWTATVLRRPPLIAPARQFIYPHPVPGEEDALERGALLAEVRPASGGVFLATCALGFRDPSLPSGIWACPRPQSLLAVAGGYGYLIDTAKPEACLHLALRPVTAVLPAVAESIVLLAGFHEVCALDAKGVLWTSARLSWEGVQLGEVRDNQLHGLGWDMITDRELPFSIDLRTGEHQGGGYNPAAR